MIRGLLAAVVLLGGCVAARGAPRPLDAPPVSEAVILPAGVEDGRARFRETYCAIRARTATVEETGPFCEAELLRLAGEPRPTGRPVEVGRPGVRLRVLVVAGLYGDCLPAAPFADALPRLDALGHDTGRIAVGGFSRVSSNAARIRDALAALELPPGQPVVVVAYSKGVVDLLEALVAFPDVRGRVKAVVSVAGPVAGTPLADRLDSSPLLAPLVRLTALSCRNREDGTLADLGRSARLDWLSRHRLPGSVRYYSLAGVGGRDRVSRILRPSYDMLARFDPRNDGAVIYSDAIIPGSKLLGFVGADHWAIALPLSRELPKGRYLGVDRNEFPRDALLEAIVRTIEEDLLSER